MKTVLLAFYFASILVSTFDGTTTSSHFSEMINTKFETNSDNRKIGEVVNHKPTITYNIQSLKQRWSERIKMATLETNNILDLEIDDVTITTEEGRYFLRGVDRSNKAKSSIRLKLVGTDLFVSDQRIIVTCTGCKSAPGHTGTKQGEPREVEGLGWYCTDCESKRCKKVVTASKDGIF